MNTTFIVTNFKKEVWEFHKTLVWVPLIIAALIFVAPLFQLMLLDDYQMDRIFGVLAEVQHYPDMENFSKVTLGAISGLFAPFLLIGLVVQMYYFVTCLFDERRDLSVYFWRSLPVSDATSVITKMVTGALVIPGIFMVGATIALIGYLLFALIAGAVLSIGYDISLWHLWGEADLFSNIGAVWISIIPYSLWMFPMFAWLMLASMFAKKAPFLWAILPVVALILIEAFIIKYFQLNSGFIGVTLANYFTFAADLLPHHMMDSQTTSFVLTSALFSKVTVAGTLMGAALMYATYWLRVNRSQP